MRVGRSSLSVRIFFSGSKRRRTPRSASPRAMRTCDAVLLVEVADEARVELLGVEPRLLPELLGALLELREVVHVALDEVAHLLGRELRAVDAGRLFAVEARRELLARLALRLVRRGRARAPRGRSAGWLTASSRRSRRRELVARRKRVGEGLEQVVDEPRVVVAAERVQVDAEELRELDEQRRRERPPVRLDEVQVARRDAEPLGELDLAQALAPAQGPDLGSEPRSSRIWHDAIGRRRRCISTRRH